MLVEKTQIKLNVDILLEALALLYKVLYEEYCHVENELNGHT
jgi:hypothetical protein